MCYNWAGLTALVSCFQGQENCILLPEPQSIKDWPTQWSISVISAAPEGLDTRETNTGIYCKVFKWVMRTFTTPGGTERCGERSNIGNRENGKWTLTVKLINPESFHITCTMLAEMNGSNDGSYLHTHCPFQSFTSGFHGNDITRRVIDQQIRARTQQITYNAVSMNWRFSSYEAF